MYRTRLHFDHDRMHIAIDSYTGELLELYTTRNYDNIIKNSMFDVHQPFVIRLREGDNFRHLHPVFSRAALYAPEKRVTVESEETEEGLLITVRYRYVSDGNTDIPADLFYTVLLHGETCRFSIHISRGFGEGVITEVRFPIIPGVWLGRTYTDDTLIYPTFTGMKYENPVEYLSRDPQYMQWRWQEYRYTYFTEGESQPGHLWGMGLRGVSGLYPGEICMSWMDLYDDDGGIYYGCHDPSGRACELSAAVLGEKMPGMVLMTTFETRIYEHDTYDSPDSMVYLHGGDWHEGAKFYRAFRQPLIRLHENRLPAWAKESAALFAHYDFKYQNGGVVHHYSDIPKMAEEARDAGIFHMLFSGWHLDGFDNGFPMYGTDPELGTEEEFIEGIRYAREIGVHVTFYVNMRLHNMRYDADSIPSKAVMHENGEIKLSHFGNGDIVFADMCPSSRGWHDQVMEFTRHATDVYGADGIYYDVISARGSWCFNPGHDHGLGEFGLGNRWIMTDVREQFDRSHGDSMMLMGEHVSDLLGGVMTLQLTQLFFKYHTGGFPEMYRYTFPEHGITDMVYPGKNMAMRPVHVANVAEEMMANAFTNGSYFWVYDLADDNTFTRDPENFALLKDLIRLRKIQLREGADLLFRDTDGITPPHCSMPRGLRSNGPEGVLIRRFSDGVRSVLAGFRFTADEAYVTFDEPIAHAEAVFSDGSRAVLTVENNGIRLPDAKAFLIFVE